MQTYVLGADGMVDTTETKMCEHNRLSISKIECCEVANTQKRAKTITANGQRTKIGDTICQGNTLSSGTHGWRD